MPSSTNQTSSGYTFLPVLLTLLLLIANVAAQHSFLNWSSVIVTFAELATPALAAMASTPAILGGGIDISIAPLFTLVSVVIEVMLLGHGVTNPALVIAVAIGFGAAIGALNGALVNYGRFQAVVATLCMTFILSGVALGYAPAPVSGTTGWLTSLGGTAAGIPGGLILIAVPLAAWLGLNRTPFVRTLRAVGGSETTAYTAGVNVAAVRTLAYALGGAIAGLAAIAIVAQLHQAERLRVRDPVHPDSDRRGRARRHLAGRRFSRPDRLAAARGIRDLPDQEFARRGWIRVSGRRRVTERS